LKRAGLWTSNPSCVTEVSSFRDRRGLS
jgi:hypothetical protein